MSDVMEIEICEYEILRAVVDAAEALCEAMCSSDDCHVLGSDYEMQYFRLEFCLSNLPEYQEDGCHRWEEIKKDWQSDALGG